MREEATDIRHGFGSVLRPGLWRSNFEQAVAATLLRRFDHISSQPRERAIDRLRYAAPCDERHDARDTKFGGFFDEPLLTISLGERYRQSDIARPFAIDRLLLYDCQVDFLPTQALDTADELQARTIEQSHFVPHS